MTRRLGSRVSTVERPRQKGWWGVPEENDAATEQDALPAAPRDTARRSSPSRPVHSVTQVGRALTPSQIEAIRTVMHLFVDDDVARGVDARATLFCQRCQANRRAIGCVRYDRFTFCNDCSTEYEIARARGHVEQAGEFLERYAARAASA